MDSFSLSAYILAWVVPVGILPLTIAVLLLQGASVFLSLTLFDDPPTAECQRAGGEQV